MDLSFFSYLIEEVIESDVLLIKNLLSCQTIYLRLINIFNFELMLFKFSVYKLIIKVNKGYYLNKTI